jgi:hypothetical protein
MKKIIFIFGVLISLMANDHSQELSKNLEMRFEIDENLQPIKHKNSTIELVSLNWVGYLEISPDDMYQALKDIHIWVEALEKVKKIEIIKKIENGYLVNYTEGGFGMETTLKMYFVFDDANRVFFMKSHEDEDIYSKTSYSVKRVEGSSEYCIVESNSIMENSWMIKTALKLFDGMMASEYKKAIESIVKVHKAKIK